MSTSKKPPVGRRGFLKGAAGGAAALVAATSQPAAAQQAADQAVAQNNIPLRNASAPLATAEKDPALNVEVLTADRPGSDFMVDCLKALGFEYIFANPGSSFRGLHESVVNYGGNKKPEFITCCHEESSVGMGHGYSKIEGKPVCVLAHGTVGLQHASMAIYNAYVDRAPVFMVIGNTLDAATRRPGVEWAHSVQDAAVLVRDFTKFDDCPFSLQHFAESSVRAYKIATTPPTMPVLLVADGDLQESPMAPGEKPHIPKLTWAAPPQGDIGSRQRNRAVAGQRRKSGDHRRSLRAHACGSDAPGRARGNAAGRGHQSVRPHEFPLAPSAQSDRARGSRHPQRRRDPGPGSLGFLGHGEQFQRSAPSHLAAHHQAQHQD